MQKVFEKYSTGEYIFFTCPVYVHVHRANIVQSEINVS